ncbi:MAG: hypothetical protein EPO65_00555 [Dehalococcoidia bacterium]|nr:MAG: hypothetical protein EPO65_00555 [Dehalococcoidia bacterium]
MDMSEQDRADLGAAIKRQRERLYGTKKAAYVAAEVNQHTWEKAERGEALRGDRLRRIVRTLWPETEGDWTLIDVAPDHQPASLEDRVVALEEQLSRLLAEHDDDQGDQATTA